jgi:threonine dehydratase
MPEDAPELKRKAAEAYGGKLILYDRYNDELSKGEGILKDDGELLALKIQEEQGLTFVSNDSFHSIAGQGTVSYEIF